MDELDQVAGAGFDLLSRVDSVLAGFGAPEGHPVWPLLRRLGILPADAVGAVGALRPASLGEFAPMLRGLSREFAELPPAGRLEWHGRAAEAFDAHWATFSAHLAGDTDTLASRLTDTAKYAEAVADWADRTRLAVARALATALTSAEAVTIITGPDLARSGGTGSETTGTDRTALAAAAADIAAHVLRAVADAYDEAEELLANASELADELRFKASEPSIHLGPNVIMLPD
jgi:uncharacterized protein YukE